MSAPALVPQALYVSIVAGPDKGISFKILSSRISIGRDDDNDITLNDPRCSRHHAIIELINGEVIVKDRGSQTGIVVNGQSCRQAKLQPGDIFGVGNTQFQIKTKTSSVPTVSGPSSPSPSRQSMGQNLPPTMSASARPGRLPIIGIVVVTVLLLLLLLQSNSKKKTGSGIRSSEQVTAEIEATQKRKEEISRIKRSEGQFSQQYMEAQAAFIQGFRDYREGNYGRATQSFTAALALYPSHELASKYRKLSERKLDEMVQYSMFEARRYTEQNKYELAKSAYKNIMVTLNDPSNKTYLEAKERYEELELLLSGKY